MFAGWETAHHAVETPYLETRQATAESKLPQPCLKRFCEDRNSLLRIIQCFQSIDGEARYQKKLHRR